MSDNNDISDDANGAMLNDRMPKSAKLTEVSLPLCIANKLAARFGADSAG